MYKGFGNIECDCCGANIAFIDFVVIKDKNGITHFCNDECKIKYQDIETNKN